ncbi:MAG: transporter substrate-binding domain-containing protein [Clostridia bacterium]|nr:transporter substrate-binding domain-containing protein [Clostridia bacterium]
MKKILALILTLVMAVSLVACGGTANNTVDNDDAAATSYSNLGVALELTSEEYGIGFRKGSDLTDIVNGYIKELNDDGTLPALAEKYELTLAPMDAEATNEATVKDLDYIKANGKLVIGITDYAPMNFKDDAGNWTGFDTEFAIAVCEKLGVEAEFVEIEWDSKFIALESKAIDCIWNGMTISDEVLKNTSCSMAYVKNAQVVVMAKDKIDQYKTAEDMTDLVFAVEAGSAGATAAEDCGFEYVEVTAQTDAILEVNSGACDACIIDITMANAMLK